MQSKWLYGFSIGCIAISTFAVPAQAGSLVNIDFDALSVGTVVTNQFENLGVTFSLLNSPPVTGPVVTDIHDTNYAPATGLAILPGDDGADPFFDIELSFAKTIDFFSMLSLDSDEPLSVQGFLDGELVQSVSFPAGTDLQVNHIQLGGIGGMQRFDRVVLNVTEGTAGGFSGGPEFYDNLSYNTVPESSSVLSLLAFGACGIGFLLRKRQ